MQKDRPFLPWEVERAFQLLDIGQHPETAQRIVMADITKKEARLSPVDDQPDTVVSTNRPEIRVAGPFEPMKAETRVRQTQLEVECRCLGRLLLRPTQSGEARGKSCRRCGIPT